MQRFLTAIVVLALFKLNTRADSGLPQPVDEDTFAALRNHSPFVRQVGESRSLILTGVAFIDSVPVATLVNLETRETHLVTEGVANLQGWQLVALKGDCSDPESLMAQIKSPGGELVSVRYQRSPPRAGSRQPTKTRLSESQLQEIKAAAHSRQVKAATPRTKGISRFRLSREM